MEKFMMLNRRRRLHHSSRVELPLVVWFLVSTYLIWILGSKLILSYLTRFCAFWMRVSSLDFVLWWSSWSLPRCLQECTAVLYIERNLHLWPHDQNLTTHQHSCYLLSSNWRLMCLLQFPAGSWLCSSFAEIFWVVGVLVLNERSTLITTYHKSRAGIPSFRKPTSSDLISDSVELWDTDVCFLHIQVMGTNVGLSKIQKIHPEVDLESSRSPAKSK